MKKRLLALVLSASLIFVMTACGSGSSGSSADPDLSPSEQTMANFVSKLEAGNYVVDIPGKIRTTVYSPEQAYMLFDRGGDSFGYAFMTIKDETFEGTLEGNAVQDAVFYYPGNAIDAMEEVLPNSWIGISNGNMFELFYGSDETPLEFTSHDENVKLTLLALNGYSQNILDYVQEVRMTMDAADPSSVHFEAVVDSGGPMIRYDNIDFTLEFGKAASDARIDSWVKDPVYPPTRTDWTTDDADMLDLVYMRGYGREAVPFPGFAGYALIFDQEAYNDFTGVLISDAHATEKDVESYKKMLLENGFAEATGTLPDGSEAPVYRKLLREDYNAYSQLYPYYDNGFGLIGTLYHEDPSYSSLKEVSGVLEQNGFPPLDDTDALTGWNAVNTAASRTESWAYFFDYDLYMRFAPEFKDEEAAKKYLDAYGEKLAAAGFEAAYAPGADSTTYTSPDRYTSFSYTLGEDNTYIIECKKEKNIPADEISKLLKEHGLPETKFSGNVSARDLTGYYHEISGFEGLYLAVNQPFASRETAEKYLDKYTESISEQGYINVDPGAVATNKSFAYNNEELGKYIAFDLLTDENGAAVSFNFVSRGALEGSILAEKIGF